MVTAKEQKSYTKHTKSRFFSYICRLGACAEMMAEPPLLHKIKRNAMDFKILNFTIFCINNVATYLNRSAKDIYHLMQDSDMIDGYIVPCYDVLHTFPKEYIVEDLVSFMQKKGVLS